MEIFISYKSENINLVRTIAEILISSEINVWIAEYNILFINYNKFEDEIKKGISKATHAIAFTNDKWATSVHCKNEKEWILDTIKPPENILEINCPAMGEHHCSHFDSIPIPLLNFKGDTINPQWTDINELVRKISDWLNIKINTKQAQLLDKDDHLYLPKNSIRFNTGSLIFMEDLTERMLTFDPVMRRGLGFRGVVEGIEITLWVFINPLFSPFSVSSTFTDRDIYKKYRIYAEDWLSELSTSHSTNGEGLHLLFTNGRSNFGMTFWDKIGEIEFFERRYALTIHKDFNDSERLGEIRLQFSVDAKGDKKKMFKKFCTISYYMDAIAKTFKYEPPTKKIILSNSIPLVASQFVWLSIFIFLSISIYNRQNLILYPYGALYFFSSLIGIIIADILAYIKSPIYRRLNWSFENLIEDCTRTKNKIAFHISILTEIFNTPYRYRKILFHNLFFLIMFCIISIRLISVDENEISKYTLFHDFTTAQVFILIGLICGTIYGLTQSWKFVFDYKILSIDDN